MMRTHRSVNVAAQLAVSLFREADEWAAKGDAANAQQALAAARSQLIQSGIDSREAAEMLASEQVPFTAEEETQRDADEAEAARVEAAREAATVERAALVEKLAAGEATSLEVQQALATLIGG